MCSSEAPVRRLTTRLSALRPPYFCWGSFRAVAWQSSGANKKRAARMGTRVFTLPCRDPAGGDVTVQRDGATILCSIFAKRMPRVMLDQPADLRSKISERVGAGPRLDFQQHLGPRAGRLLPVAPLPPTGSFPAAKRPRASTAASCRRPRCAPWKRNRRSWNPCSPLAKIWHGVPWICPAVAGVCECVPTPATNEEQVA